MPVVFPVHPRTRARARRASAARPSSRGPAPGRPGRLPRLPLAARPTRAPCSPTRAGSRRRRPSSACPCFTLRDNTERPITIERRHEPRCSGSTRRGSPTCPGCSPRAASRAGPPPLWDGHAAERLAADVDRAPSRRKSGLCRVHAGRACRVRRFCDSARPMVILQPRPQGPRLLRPPRERRARTPSAPPSCCSRCSSAGPTSARAWPARSSRPSRRATGSPTTSSSASTRPS